MSNPLGGNKREYSVGGQARFRNPVMLEPTPRDRVSLSDSHEAVIKGRTIHPSRVFDASERDRVFIEGINNAKIGNRITVGPWAGLRLYNLSLEERATCPRSCALYAECFGNGMPMAVRFRYNDALMRAIARDLDRLESIHSNGFAIRLHVLGDFPDLDYLRRWCEWSDEFEGLRIWGYTAHAPDSEIGAFIARANAVRPERWRIRFSVAEGTAHGPMQVTTAWTKPSTYSFDRQTSSMVCPQEIGKTDHCATCGICWKPELEHVRVVFMGHGGSHHRNPSANKPAPSIKTPTPQRRISVHAPVTKHDPSLDDLVREAIAAGRVKRIEAKDKSR